MKTFPARWALLGLLAFCFMSPFHGAAAAAEEEERDIDPEAAAVLQRFADSMKELERFSVGYTVHIDVEAQGLRQEMTQVYELSVERPNRFAMIPEDGAMGSGAVLSDGERLYIHVPMLGQYMAQDAPESLDNLPLETTIAMGDPFQALLILASDDPYGILTDDVSEIAYLGETEIGGEPCMGVELENQDMRMILHFAADEAGLLRRITADLSAELGDMAAMLGEETRMDLWADLEDWVLDPEFDEAMFAFDPPADHEAVESFFAGGMDEGGPTELLGEEAPSFGLSLMDGGAMELSDHLGEDVVVLDFWATWCPPCVEALPILREVTGEFADENVVFYAVNVQEEPDRINEFLEREGLELTVALDAEGQVSNRYGVRAIPTTVIVGKDGSVQAVHIGMTPGLEGQLREELTVLAGGGTLTD